MSALVTTHSLLDLPTIGRNAKLYAAALGGYPKRDPSRRQLTAALGIGPKGIAAALRELEEAAVVVVVRPTRRDRQTKRLVEQTRHSFRHAHFDPTKTPMSQVAFLPPRAREALLRAAVGVSKPLVLLFALLALRHRSLEAARTALNVSRAAFYRLKKACAECDVIHRSLSREPSKGSNPLWDSEYRSSATGSSPFSNSNPGLRAIDCITSVGGPEITTLGLGQGLSEEALQAGALETSARPEVGTPAPDFGEGLSGDEAMDTLEAVTA